MNNPLSAEQVQVLASHLAWVQKNQPALFTAFAARIVEAAKAHKLLAPSLVTTLSPAELVLLILKLSQLGVELQSQAAGMHGLGQTATTSFGDIATGVSSFLQSLATTVVGTKAALATISAQNQLLQNG